MANVVVEMSGDEAKLWRSLTKIQGKSKDVEGGFKKIERSGKRAGKQSEDAFGPKALGGLTAIAGGLASIGGALGAVNAGYQNYLRNMREISTETNKAGNQMVAFAALQAGGTKAERVQIAALLGARHGVDRGEAFNTVQAMQSAASAANPEMSEGDAFNAGLKSAGAVFRAKQVGIPVASGLEAEILGAAQGANPGEFLRRSYISGQASSRDPAMLAKSASAMQFFPDKDFGFAASAVLAGAFGDELKTYAKGGGRGLSEVSPAQKWFKAHGVGDASQLEQLRALKTASMDTPAELKGIGYQDMIQQQALATMVQNFGAVERITRENAEKNKPGLLGASRAAIEDELPIAKLTKKAEVLDQMFKHTTAFGASSEEAQMLTINEKVRAIALRRMGLETIGPFGMWDTIEESDGGGGRATKATEMLIKGRDVARRVADWSPLGGAVDLFVPDLDTGGRLDQTMQGVRRELNGGGETQQAVSGDLSKAGRDIREAAGIMRQTAEDSRKKHTNAHNE